MKILITGGAGFIGVNSADYFAEKGWNVTVLDNLSRRGTEDNLQWLLSRRSVEFKKIDVRDFEALSRLVGRVQPDVLLHLAAQVAVTTSVRDPREDFEINALGTLNVLEAVRLQAPQAFLINASTNKVYGKMDEVGVMERKGRYEYRDLPQGVGEAQPQDFHSPYGCSKGAADQYTIDYARIYGLRTVTFRQSCIYGPRQIGIEDQGWVAWFTIAAVLGQSITIYGDGKQIRDLLHVNDLVKSYESAIEHQSLATGQAFNIGGGPGNTMSLLELVEYLETEISREIPFLFAGWRPGDQRVFVSDTAKARRVLEWEPQITVRRGVSELLGWVSENTSLVAAS